MVHQFMSSMIESHTLELHVHMAQTILQRCILDPPLQNELFCHLIKQTSRHPIQTRSTVQVRGDDTLQMVNFRNLSLKNVQEYFSLKKCSKLF